MAVSKRGYLTIAELEAFSNITVTDSDEAVEQISMAEEIIDAYVGPQDKAYQRELVGLASAGGSNTITLQLDQQQVYEKNYFKFCHVEIIGGAGEGQVRQVLSSEKDGELTLTENWSTNPDTTSYYRIFQLGKFPRKGDEKYYTTITPLIHLKSIPDAVRRATAAQVQYMIEMGDSFFTTDQSEKTSESIGYYSYSIGDGQAVGATGGARFIAPRAKVLLRGIKNRTGTIL